VGGGSVEEVSAGGVLILLMENAPFLKNNEVIVF